MKKLLFLLVALSLLWVYQANVNVASAHGGHYRGPAGEVPPGQRDPKDPQPPPENPGVPTPGQDGPPTGTPPPGGPPSGGGGDESPPDNPRPTPPAPNGPTGAPPGGNTATPGGRVNRPPPMSFENWLFWWNYNKDEILNLKARIKANENQVSTKSSSTFFGGSYNGNKSDTQKPTEAMIKKLIIPNLEKVVADKSIHPDIRGGALIALARCGGDAALVKTFFKIASPQSKEDKVVRESAILALGIMQLDNSEIRDYLVKFVDNTDDQFRVRCFAQISLGLLKAEDDEVFECLKRSLSGRESTPDVPVCALLAMGLIGDAKRVPEMIEWMEVGKIGRNKLDDLTKAYLVGALGKIADQQALKPIFGTLRKKGTYTKRSALIAMGQILPQVDPDLQKKHVTELAKYLKNESDQTAKNFGLISLGRIGGMADVREDIRDHCVRVLLESFKKGSKATERPYAALALGLLCFESEATARKPEELKYKIAETIRTELAKLRGDKTALGALAIALGVIGDRNEKTVKLLINVLKDRGEEKKLRGAAAVALGLIGDASAKEPILNALREREDRDLRVDTAVAAGLIGDSGAVEALVAIMNDQKASQFVLGSVALALGQIGDHRAVETLIKILEPDKQNGVYPDLTRALVAVALGQVADRRDIRVLARISKDINYRASVSAVDELLTIL